MEHYINLALRLLILSPCILCSQESNPSARGCPDSPMNMRGIQDVSVSFRKYI